MRLYAEIFCETWERDVWTTGVVESLGTLCSTAYMCKEIPSSYFFPIRLYIDHMIMLSHLKPTSARSPSHAVQKHS